MMSLLDDNTLKIGDDQEMYTKLNERSELERFRQQYESEELEDMAERYRGLWEPKFEANHRKFDKGVDGHPLHPWKVLKRVRQRYAEEENDGSWPSMAKRHALRVVKDEYAEKWRQKAYD